MFEDWAAVDEIYSAQSLDELQWLHLKIGDQYSDPSNGHQGDMPCCIHSIINAVLFCFAKTPCKPLIYKM